MIFSRNFVDSSRGGVSPELLAAGVDRGAQAGQHLLPEACLLDHSESRAQNIMVFIIVIVL